MDSGAYPREEGIPLEPNAQRKNLLRLKDLRGPIQRKSTKFPRWVFFYEFSWVYSSIWNKKERYMWTKSMFTSRQCVCFFSSRRTSRWPDSQHENMILAKFLSRERSLSFPFIAFLRSILSTLQFDIKKNQLCLSKVCLWSAQKRPNGRHCITEILCVELQHTSLLLAWS